MDEKVTARNGLRMEPYQGIFRLLVNDRHPELGGTDAQRLRVLIGTRERRLAGLKKDGNDDRDGRDSAAHLGSGADYRSEEVTRPTGEFPAR
ncbi:hypothetical protein [Actinopolymorpha pittospori]